VRQEIIPDAKTCPACAGDGGHWDRWETGGHEEYDAWMECEDCHGTGYVIPASVRSDRPAQPGDTIELAVARPLSPLQEYSGERVVAVAVVRHCGRDRHAGGRWFWLSWYSVRPPSHKENP
jgi:hypothetical protein